MSDFVVFSDFTDAADDLKFCVVDHVSLHVVCVSMGRNKADGSGREQHRKTKWCGTQARRGEYSVCLERQSRLVIVDEQVL